MRKVIGISGVAGAGKDLLFVMLAKALARKKINAYRYALADELKNEIGPVLFNLYKVDINACDGATKNMYRPLLVFHGRTRRDATEGRYWIEKLEKKIKLENLDGVSFITDVRYDFYDKDELFWLKNEMGGLLVHLSQFEIKNGEKIMRLGANEDELKFDPIIKAKADYRIEWGRACGSQANVEFSLNRHVEELLIWLDKND